MGLDLKRLIKPAVVIKPEVVEPKWLEWVKKLQAIEQSHVY